MKKQLSCVEIWKDISWYEWLYRVSNLGNVKSFFRSKKVLKNVVDNGYHIVSLHKNKSQKKHRVHRLVLKAFLENPENKPSVNHINGIKTDNRLGNLEWCTQQENVLHGYRVLWVVNKSPCFIPWSNSMHAKKVLQFDLEWVLVKKWGSMVDAEKEWFRTNCISAACSWRYKTHWWYKWKLAKTLTQKT